MKPSIIKLTFFLLMPSLLFSQDFDDYKPLKATGKIPNDFTVVSSEAYNEAKENIDKKAKKFDRKSQKKFHLMNSFSLHEMLYSGKMLFNDALTNYASRVLDEILKNDKNLRSQIRVYVVKTPYVNAFATNNGLILINEGLIAQLETEAQLAFILCHELTHFTKKHVINQYVETEKIKTGRTVERFKKSNEKLFAINNYSKETEKEADQIGLELYKKSNYDLNQIQGVFDVLEFSYLPFDEVEYEKTFLETGNFKFPTKLYPDSLKKLPTGEDEDDTHSTHPSTQKRRKYIGEAVANINNSGRKEYIVSKKDEFMKIRKIARYELIEEYITQRDYAEALYCIFLLQKENPKSNYLKKSKLKCLYSIAKYKNAGNYSSISTEYSDVYGESQSLHYLLNETGSAEFSVFVLKTLWNEKQNNPSDSLTKNMTNDLIKDMAINHFETLNDFKLTYPIIDTSSKEKEDTIKVKSKYEKVKRKVVKETIVEDYYKYAFVEEFKLTNLQSEYKKIGNIAIKRKEYEKSDDYKKELAKYNKKIKKKGYKLGIDKVVIASPFYLTVDERKKDQVRYLDSEEAEQNFIYTLKNNASLNKLEVDCLDDIDVKNITTDSYNDYAYINKWFNIKSKENKLDISLIDLNKEETDAFIKKHGTKYVCWIGTVAVREKKSYKDAPLLCLTAGYYLPFFIINAMTPEYETYFYSITYNIETRKPLMIRYDLINRNDTKGQMNSILYDTFYQIKTK